MSPKQRVDAGIFRVLSRWDAWVRRRASLVCAALVALTLPLGGYAALNLGVNVDTVRVIHPETPSRIALEAFSKLFPVLNEAIIVVIDARTPDQARDAIEELQRALEARPETYRDVYVPGGGDFFAHNGLLYLSLDELDELSEELTRAQPLIAELERDASLMNLSRLVELGLDERALDGSDDLRWSGVLDRISYAIREVREEHPVPVSWEDLLLGDASGSTQRVLLVEADIDPNSLFDAGRAAEQLRETAVSLGFGPERGVEMRLTGNPILNHDEILGLLFDIGVGGVICFLFVMGVLTRAFRSFRMVVAATATLVVGLVWTGAFAAATVGNLNVISLSFAILFIGLGVDFTIHLGMHYAASRHDGMDDGEAMQDSLRQVGSSLVICTLTTATGFYVFVPTYYSGVAELGLIAGSGMFIVLFLTTTLFPALLSSWLRVETQKAGPGAFALEQRAFDRLARHPAWVRRAAAALAIAAAATLPFARFDPNNVLLRDPGTESVQTFEELLGGREEASPWFANVLAPDFEAADELAKRMAELDLVSNAITLTDYVPEDQDEKREVLADIAFMLQPTDVARKPAPSLAEEREALRRLAELLAERADGGLAPDLSRSVARLEAELQAFLDAPDPDGARLAELEAVLLEPMPRHIERLRRALEPDEITLDDLPQELVRRMIAPDGRIRVQIYPAEDLRERNALTRFVHQVVEAEPSATGMAVNLVGFGDATVSSFRQALISALVLITVYLVVLWQRFRETALVLAPLLLGALLTVAGMVALGLSFNFVNIIVVPLLLGIGADSGIHLVHRASAGEAGGRDMVGSTTARAVLFSAITTIVSFGALALSSHRGMASLGILLTVGLCWMLVCNLVVLPALLERFPARARAAR
ncbi:MAG: MMPL family transporter [Myxococcota bacterium]|nr:MMPL family transporter [Myxococcota bacterium]